MTVFACFSLNLQSIYNHNTIKTMFKNTLLALFTIALISACSAPAADSNSNHFGETITKNGSISYDDLLTKLTSVDSMDTKVTGTVSAVCQKKGCWMTIVSDESDQEMRVKFKDYGFFVPMDISGKKVVFEGKAFRDITSVDDLRHYAEDEGLSKEEIEAITEPEEAYNFLASGVLLLDK